MKEGTQVILMRADVLYEYFAHTDPTFTKRRGGHTGYRNGLRGRIIGINKGRNTFTLEFGSTCVELNIQLVERIFNVDERKCA